MDKRKYLLYPLLAVGIIFCITPIREFLLFRNYPVKSFLDDSGVFANFLAPFFPIGFVLLAVQQNRISKILFSLPVIVLLATILLTNSRTALIAVIASAIYVLVKLYPAVFSKILSNLTTVIITVSLFIISFSFLVLYKEGSAKGRTLIYSVALNMIEDKPLFGHGPYSFKKVYLNYQAKYFEKNPDSDLAIYADDTKFAFNEYLQIAVEFGFTGLMILGLILYYCFSIPDNTPNRNITIGLKSSLIAVCCLSMFSYPLRNTCTFLEVLLTVLLLCIFDKRSTLLFKFSWILLLVAVGANAVQRWNKEILTQQFIATQINNRKSLQQKLIILADNYLKFKSNGSFLALYGLNLSLNGQYEKSNQVFNESLRYMDDINVRVLIGNNFQQLKNYREAEKNYINASNMIPCRFIPLYQLAALYKETGDTSKLLQVAKRIIDKPIKISSYTVSRIKQEMEEVILNYTK